jgi:ankyrin repeat protein
LPVALRRSADADGRALDRLGHGDGDGFNHTFDHDGKGTGIVQRLLDAGIEIDRQNGNGATCLMYVSSNGKPALVKQLLENGADPTLRNFDDFSALDLAATLDCLKLLRRAGR